MNPLNGKLFSTQESDILQDIILNRRDVRGNRFLNRPVAEETLDKLLMAALHAPSVGFSQPWEFVVIRNQAVKSQIKQSFEEENEKAGQLFADKKQEKYMQLKLEGIEEAPLNLAVFYKPATEPVLGQTAMPEAGLFSVVCAIQNMWLMARALNIGLGWVSILDPDKVKTILKAPLENRLVAYLCIGYVDGFFTQPELELLQWEKRKLKESIVFYDSYQSSADPS
jgi:5,6-dimethylbenzimidazole synthase